MERLFYSRRGSRERLHNVEEERGKKMKQHARSPLTVVRDIVGLSSCSLWRNLSMPDHRCTRMVQVLVGIVLATVVLGTAGIAQAQQRVGKFKWALQPFCDVLVFEVLQIGGVFSLNGSDDNCGGSTSATLTGTAVLNKDGSIGFGFTFNQAPFASHIWAQLNSTSVSGPWHDDVGGAGTLTFLGPAAPSDLPLSGEPYHK
jgi:hypothetical protein